MIRPVLNTAMFNEVALSMSRSSTKSGTIAICAGILSP